MAENSEAGARPPRSEADQADEALIRTRMAKSTGFPPEEIDLQLPLSCYGLDSLLEVEFMLEPPDCFGNLDHFRLPLPLTGLDLVHYTKLNREAGNSKR